MSITSELTELKEQLEEAAIEQSKIQGRKDQLIIQLKEKFKVPTIEKANKLLSKMKTELENMSGRLKSGLDKFKEDYGEDLDAIN